MTDRPPHADRVRELFLEALDRSGAEREAFLRDACAGDEALRAEVESLLRHDDPSDGFLETPASARSRQGVVGDDGTLPERVGPFSIVRRLGEGGSGIVLLAQQAEPERLVAIKVLRGGSLSTEALRRFRHEAGFLGRLRHPGIATIFEVGIHEHAGASAPYFAMEYVEGQALTAHADEHALTTAERIELFLQVCEAVQHAHARGVIHRDLKPANILVDADGRARVLDFGVARATDADLGETRTAAGRVIGTLAYMSPEQIAGDPDAVDTRSDVYSLGVVLYELLAGRLPHRVTTLADAARAIGHEAPPPLGSLDRQLRGDLETITRTALEKERDRRYAGAAELAADLRRHLRNEPILARDPSALYQARKFAARNRALVAASLAIAAATVIGLVAVSLALVRSRAAESETRAAAETVQAVNDFLVGVLDQAHPAVAQGREVTVREAVEDAVRLLDSQGVEDPRVEIAIRKTVGLTYNALGLYEDALRQLALGLEVVESVPDPSAETRAELLYITAGTELGADRMDDASATIDELDAAVGSLSEPDPQLLVRASRVRSTLEWKRGDIEAAEAQAERTIKLADRLLGRDHPDAAHSRMVLSSILRETARPERARALNTEALEAMENASGPDHPDTIAALSDLASTLHRAGEPEEAERRYLDALERRTRVLGPDHPRTLETKNNLAQLLGSLGRTEESVAIMRDVLEVQRRDLPPDHIEMLSTMNNLAIALKVLEEFDEAIELQREAMQGLAATVGERHPLYLTILNNIASTLRLQGRTDEAIEAYASLSDIVQELLGESHPTTHAVIHNLGGALYEAGRNEEALEEFERTVRLAEAVGADYPPAALGIFLRSLGSCHTRFERWERAIELYLRSHEMLASATGPTSNETLQARDELARAYEAIGDTEAAERWRAAPETD